MKKRCFALILACLVLCGCSAQKAPDETTSPPVSAAETSATTPEGLYDPGSAIESQTNGAVRCYPLSDTYATNFLPLGEVLLISACTETSTTLTILSGEELYPSATLELDMVLSPNSPSLRSCNGGFSFFNDSTLETVVLDTSLREIRRISAPEALTGVPMLSTDRSTLYYCTADAIRALDLETGISRILKEMSYSYQAVTGLWLEDSVLECSISDGETSQTLFLSTETGQTLNMESNLLSFCASSDRYYAVCAEGATQLYLFGSLESDAQVLNFLGDTQDCYFLPEDNAAVVVRQSEDTQIVLDYYDLDTGCRTASLNLVTELCPWGFASTGDGQVTFLNYDASYGCNALYRWDTAATPVNEETVYAGPHYTRSDPDYDGLAACTLYAQEISERYGIEVLVYKDAIDVQPWDYDLEAEYLVPVLQKELEQLDTRLGNYPDGFLRTLSECFGGIKICIVRSITGSAESGSLESANGIQFWDDNYVAYLALAAGMETEHALYHELCHLIDTKVLTECSAYDTWDKLNPADFEYDNDYITNLERDDQEYLGEKRYFIDTYSMSYPKEDRARIMEYAMTPNHEGYFQSTPMQAKLLTLCQAIREAFGLKKSPETFLWEQYLNNSLAYTE